MPINSNAKGKAGERELSRYLTDHGFPARRGQQYAGGYDSPDVVCYRLAELGLQIECKRVESLNIHKAIEQAQADCGAGAVNPVVMHRKNGKEWLATMPLDTLLDLLSQLG
jgi:Holliday junction resolvase